MHSFLVRLIQVLVTLKLGPSINAQLPHTVLAYRPIDGVRTGLHIARALMRRGFDWGARADIKAFFPSIRTRHVEIALPRLVPIQDTMLQLLSWMMSAPIVRGLDHPLVASGVAGVRSEALHALYQGSSVAPLLSNGVGAVCFDIPFALEMKQAAVLLRYADDLLILARDPRVARAGMDLVHALAEVWGFRVHDDPVKTSREPVDLRKDSFTWLGYELGRGGVTLPNAKFVDTVASLAALDPWDRRVRGTFIEAVMKLAFDGGARLDDLRESAAMVSDAHFMAVESAIAHVKENIRTGWIARWQRFAAPVLEEVSG